MWQLRVCIVNEREKCVDRLGLKMWWIKLECECMQTIIARSIALGDGNLFRALYPLVKIWKSLGEIQGCHCEHRLLMF